MTRLTKALWLGLATGLIGVVLLITPPGQEAEENFGLSGLFLLRGERPPPPEVVIVSLDKVSSDHLGLLNRPERWPRGIHGRLLDALTRQGAAVVAFDMIFDEPREPAQDTKFAEAVKRAGNVVLFEYLKKEIVPLSDAAGNVQGEAVTERLVSPLPILVQSAAATAPFSLPRVPVKVSQCWLYKAGAGDRATLPVAAFQLFALPAYDDFLRLLRQVSPAQAAALPASREAIQISNDGIQKLIQQIRHLLREDPALGRRLLRAADELPANQRRLLHALLRLYQSNDSRYLNFYGQPRTITTIPYYEMLEAETARTKSVNLRGAAVFVGFAENQQPEQKDGFYTVFTQESGLDVSGVEIAATVFANLLEDNTVQPLALPAQLIWVIVWGLLTGFVCLWWRALPGIALLTGLCLLYSVFAYFRFVSAAQWYPLIIPLFVQAPAALFAGLLWHYLDTNRERQHIRRAFGYYLPDTVVDDLARNMTDVRDDKKLVYGVCLATDAEQYTALAESLPPEQLGALMNRYYAAVFGPVRDHGGFVSDVIGDAMLAIWAGSGAEHDLRAQACRAALGIAQSVNRFNQSADNSRLPTRLGLHAGPLLLGNVGAINHYEYRAVGDIVNTATRIQGLNKILGTRILVAQESLQGLAGFLARDVGVFLLPGKSKPIAVSELLCASEDADDSARESCALFAAALADYAARRWAQAQAGFQRLCELNPADGAAAFYLGLCERCLSAPPDSAWCATVRIDTK